MGLDVKNLHHAILLVGMAEEADSYIRSLCSDLDIKIANNPDFFAFRTDTFGIDEARQLKSLSINKTVTGRKIFFISPVRMTLEAQNALLKTFEDPPSSTHFFLVTREEALILPTLRSRMKVMHLSQGLTLESQDAKKFLSLSVKDRLLFAKKFVAEEKNLVIFLDSLLSLLRTQDRKQKSIKAIYNIRRIVNESVSSRLVIEHLSLVL